MRAADRAPGQRSWRAQAEQQRSTPSQAATARHSALCRCQGTGRRWAGRRRPGRPAGTAAATACFRRRQHGRAAGPPPPVNVASDCSSSHQVSSPSPAAALLLLLPCFTVPSLSPLPQLGCCCRGRQQRRVPLRLAARCGPVPGTGQLPALAAQVFTETWVLHVGLPAGRSGAPAADAVLPLARCTDASCSAAAHVRQAVHSATPLVLPFCAHAAALSRWHGMSGWLPQRRPGQKCAPSPSSTRVG